MLYTPEMVNRLQQLRATIYTEFGIRIRLADPELLDMLSALGERCGDEALRHAIEEVLIMAGRKLDRAPSAGSLISIKEITYRGQKMTVDGGVVDASSTAAVTPRVYRGRVFYK